MKIMTFNSLRRFAPLAICAAGLAIAAAPTAASADIQWVVTGTFDDGSTLSGQFDVNVNDGFASFDLKTSAGPVIGAQEYASTDSTTYNWIGETFVEFQPNYTSDLHLEFTDSLYAAEANNVILTGPTGPSFECIESYSCSSFQGPTRFLVSASAVGTVVSDDLGFNANGGGGNGVPEPASWALMITGFGMAGGLLRAARRRSALA
jgi:hypothetical protein